MLAELNTRHLERQARIAANAVPVAIIQPTPQASSKVSLPRPLIAPYRDWLFIASGRQDFSVIRTPSIRQVQQAVIEYFNITMLDLLSIRRTAHVVRPRQVAMYLARTLTTRTLPEIGRAFGGRDHTTILHSYRKIMERMKTSATLLADITLLENKLGWTQQR